MKFKRSYDLWVGVFVISGIIALSFIILKTSSLTNIPHKKGYALYAKFDEIGGLKKQASVRVAGVVIGRISDIHLDQEDYMAKVGIQINDGIAFPDDSILIINTDGILGQKYLSISPGGSPVLLEPGDYFDKTQSALILEKLISQFLFNIASK